MKPPVPYFGSKSTLAPWIVSLLPDHEHYVEPFAGSLSVLLAKRPSRMETVNDLDGELMTFWRILRDRPDELIRACALTPHSRAEYIAAHQPTEDELEIARRVWVRLTQSRSGVTRRTGWRHHVNPAGDMSTPARLDVFRDRIPAAAERLMSVSLECLPALDLIAQYGAQPKCLLYVDPPYLGSTRGANYRHEMRDELEHRELAKALADCRAAVVLSGYHSPLYDELYEGWHRYETSTFTGNATANHGRTEVVWSNRVLAGQVDLFAEVSA